MTNAESNNHWSYHLANIESIRNLFGDYIHRAVRGSLTQLKEAANRHPPETIESVKMKMPKDTMQDVIITLDIGSSKELARTLFPYMSPKIASFLWPESSDGALNKGSEPSGTPYNWHSCDISAHDCEFNWLPDKTIIN